MTAIVDWEAEARGLGYMLLDIAAKYEQAQHLGGDSELLRAAVTSAHAYVDGPLRDALNGSSTPGGAA